jgi:hypothetical protein
VSCSEIPCSILAGKFFAASREIFCGSREIAGKTLPEAWGSRTHSAAPRNDAAQRGRTRRCGARCRPRRDSCRPEPRSALGDFAKIYTQELGDSLERARDTPVPISLLAHLERPDNAGDARPVGAAKNINVENQSRSPSSFSKLWRTIHASCSKVSDRRDGDRGQARERHADILRNSRRVVDVSYRSGIRDRTARVWFRHR